MSDRATPVVLAGLLLAAAPGAAQTPYQSAPPQRVVSLQAASPHSWDAAFQAGWFTRNKSNIAADWNDWYDAAAFSASLGYYWTPHLKAELDVTTTTSAAVQVDNIFLLPGPVPFYRPREHRFRATQAGVSLIYQFLENRWFHPFLGGGVSATHETERAADVAWVPYLRDPQTGLLLPPLDAIATDRTEVHPVIAGGFKAYVSERVFLRSDLRTEFSSDGADLVVLRTGIGFDF